MISFIIGAYLGGFIVEAASDYVTLGEAKRAVFAGAIWPYTIVRTLIRGSF